MALLQGRAYGIFVSEIGRHLRWAHNTFDANHDLESESLQEARRRFHTIKGGAGFFGLDEIASTAERLQKFFSNASSEIIDDMEQARKWIVELEQFAAQLPKPKESPDSYS